MSIEISLESPLAEALNAAIQPKLVEVGWSSGGADDSALSEYILLMLVNGKTQDQIATELSGDLLNLGPDDPGARDFSQWLFEQAEYLKGIEQSAMITPVQAEATNGPGQSDGAVTSQDAEMGDAAEHLEGNIPTGPKSMRNGANRGRDKRMFGQLEKAMDRTQDSILHRVRSQGTERINSHTRGAPTGPRSVQGRGGRPQLNRPMGGQPSPGMAANVGGMTAQQQRELYAMLEQQSRMMAQMFTPQQQQQMMMANNAPSPIFNGGMNHMPHQAQQSSGRSLFDRVQRNPQANVTARKGTQAAVGRPNGQAQNNDSQMMSMDVELTPAPERASPDTTCKFNLSCTNKDCLFAHQSPAAPPGTAIDVSDSCSFGAACKNRKCTARHPSPAQKIAHQTEQDCKFFPNCTNPRCPFKHPSMPLCRNGADCTTSNCKFTHVKTMCKFNPCLNPGCAFKHEEGQKRGKFDDKVWVAGEKEQEREHVSERKFVNESEAVEELIVPGNPEATNSAEIVT